MYFVGHSLGGGISEIVAANLHEDNEDLGYYSHVQSYGVCSPGVLLSSAKFGFSVEALDFTSSSLLPRRDVVSMVDEHGGSVQYSECNAQSMATCHKMDNVLCELYYGCPSTLARPFTAAILDNFCETSAAGEWAQIGKSIMNVSAEFNVSAGTNVEEWTLDEIRASCDNGVYDFCRSNNTALEESCNHEFDSWDLCSQDDWDAAH